MQIPNLRIQSLSRHVQEVSHTELDIFSFVRHVYPRPHVFSKFLVTLYKMHSFTLIPFLLGATTFVAADPILPIIPFIESVVSSATSAFAPAVQYTGPTGTAAAILATSSTIKVAATVTPAPYWLEEIKHQGVAAFNPSPATYQVFRNVKDFGAKGMSRAVTVSIF